MALVVVAGGVLKCDHGGQLKLGSGDDRLTVDGSGAVPAGREGGLSFAPGPSVIAPCTKTLPNGAPSPCTTSPATQGTSTKLEVGGSAVLLDTAQGDTVNPAGPVKWSVADAGQTKLEAS